MAVSVISRGQMLPKSYILEFYCEGSYLNGESINKVALENIRGSAKVPARNFAKVAKNILLQYMTPAEMLNPTLMEQAGVRALQSAILIGQYAPNAPSTIKRKGNGNVLRDTYTMINSFTGKKL